MLLIAACASPRTTATTETSKQTICRLIGITGKDGTVRAPEYSASKDTPETIADVRFKIAQGAAYDCWPGEDIQ